jgi:hypothetical protein
MVHASGIKVIKLFLLFTDGNEKARAFVSVQEHAESIKACTLISFSLATYIRLW